MATPQISVAMCTYNGSKYLWEQLQSIASQTQLPSELVICDDGSADNTAQLLQTFAAQAAFHVQVVSNKERLGPAKNFEKAIRLCTGDIIVLSDQDDIWKPQKLATLLSAFEEHPEAVYAFSNAELVNADGTPQNLRLWDTVEIRKNWERFSGPEQLKILLKQNVVTGATMAFRSKFRDIFLPVPPGWMHDYWIAALGSALYTGIPIPEPLILYRQHAMQVVGTVNKPLPQMLASLASNRNSRVEKVEAFRVFFERIQGVSELLPCPDASLRLIQEQRIHLLNREKIRSARRVARISKVLVEAFTGRYQRYSESWRSIARDLLMQ